MAIKFEKVKFPLLQSSSLIGVAMEKIDSGDLVDIKTFPDGIITVKKMGRAGIISSSSSPMMKYPKGIEYTKGIEDLRDEIFKVVGDGEESAEFRRVINDIISKLIK